MRMTFWLHSSDPKSIWRRHRRRIKRFRHSHVLNGNTFIVCWRIVLAIFRRQLDAWGFIDPIYSSGVYFALHSGVLAGDAIVEGLANGDLSGEQLGKWTAEFGEGTQWIRKLVHAYYSNEFSFGHFMKEHPEHRGNLTDLLIGRIFYDGAGRIFDDMDPAIKQSLERARDNASAMQSADASETQ